MRTPAEVVKALEDLFGRVCDARDERGIWDNSFDFGCRAQRLYLHWWRSALQAQIVALAKSRERAFLHTRDDARALVRAMRGSAQIDVVLERVERAVREWDGEGKTG